MKEHYLFIKDKEHIIREIAQAFYEFDGRKDFERKYAEDIYNRFIEPLDQKIKLLEKEIKLKSKQNAN